MIRVARVADIPTLQAIRGAVRENRLISLKLSDADYRAALAIPSRTWVSEDAHQITGFASGNAGSGNIWALFVHPEHEGRGHGRALHDAMVRWMFEQGCRQLWLTTDPATRAADFYRSAGWVECGLTAEGELRFELSRR